MERVSDGEIEEEQKRCYKSWMSVQAKNVDELKQALIMTGAQGTEGDVVGEVSRKVVGDFEEYVSKRWELARRSSFAYFAPSWNTPMENALMWMSGCRPSGFIRLIYALCGSQTELLLGGGGCCGGEGCSIGDITASQLAMINDLHVATVHEEEKVSRRVASLQEDTSDMPVAVVAYYKEVVGEADVEVERALDKNEEALAEVVSDADKLRLTTVKRILEILTAVQAAEFLVAAQKLHLCMHEWGKFRDRRRHDACPYAALHHPPSTT